MSERSRSDLVPAEHRQRTAERLVQLVREADTHLGTGFLATPLLLPVLADAGHLDLAYELLQRRTPPSWLAMIDRGATTVWELWEGVDVEGQAHMSPQSLQQGRGDLIPVPIRVGNPACGRRARVSTIPSCSATRRWVDVG